MSPDLDFIIVGGGSAGCVVASKLARAGRRTLLIESGPQPTTGDIYSPLHDASRLVFEGFNWNYHVNLRTPHDIRPTHTARWQSWPYPLGRVMGGSSAVNGALALAALPDDMTRWANHGLPEWSWDHTSSWFERQLTSVLNVGSLSRDELHPLDAAFARACENRGATFVDLTNPLPATPIVGALPTNTVQGRRRDAASIYLDDSYPYLSVLTGATVDSVVIQDGRARGVRAHTDNGEYSVDASYVVLCAGALGTPAILQRSGIGDRDLLETLGIDTLVHSPGVGRNLHDHTSLVIWAESNVPPVPRTRWRDVIAFMPGGYDDVPDALIGTLHDVDTESIPAFAGRLGSSTAAGMSTMLMRPSSTGAVCITDRDVNAPLQTHLSLLDTAEDLDRMTSAVRTAWSLFTSPDCAPHVTTIHSWSSRIVNNDKALRSAVRNLAAPAWHACGTAAMGPAGDPDRVVDATGAVVGVEALSVADASVFPFIPSVPTNVTTMVVAERLADALIARTTTTPDLTRQVPL